MLPVRLLQGYVLLWSLLALSSLGLAPLFDLDETIYAQTALDMWRQGHWLVPEANGMRFFEKPPFVYYLMDLSFALFGENAWAARLPSALFTLATAGLLVVTGSRLFSREFGWLAAAIFLSMLEVGLLAHAAILDPALNFFLAASFCAWVLWRVGAARRHGVLAGLASGLAVAVKGPVGLAVPALVFALDWLVARERPRLSAFPWLGAALAFLAAAAPWYLMLLIESGPAFFYEFILVHNLGRALHPMQGHGGGWWYYLVVFAVSVLPWLAWMPHLARAFSPASTLAPARALMRAGFIWTGAVLVLFSLAATKLPHYISCIYPVLALMLACAWFVQPPAGLRRLLAATAAILLPLGLAEAALPWLWPWLVELVRHPRAQALLMDAAPPDASLAFIGLVLAASAVWLAFFRTHARGLAAMLAAGLVLQSALLFGLGPLAGRVIQGPLLAIADRVRAAAPELPLLSFRLNAPSVSFYSGRNYRMADAGDIARMRAEKRPFLLMMRAESADLLAELPAPTLARGGYLLFEVRP